MENTIAAAAGAATADSSDSRQAQLNLEGFANSDALSGWGEDQEQKCVVDDTTPPCRGMDRLVGDVECS